MATDATGVPTTKFSIPKFNTAVDAPSGLGTNAMMDAIDGAIANLGISTIVNNDVPVWDSGASKWKKTSGTPSATTFLRGDGGWNAPPNTELVFATATSLSGTSTSPSAPQTIVSLGAQTFDGITPYLIEFWAVAVTHTSATNVVLALYDGSGATNLGNVFFTSIPIAGNNMALGLTQVRITPSSGSHTYFIGMYSGGSGTATLSGGPTNVYMRLVRA